MNFISFGNFHNIAHYFQQRIAPCIKHWTQDEDPPTQFTQNLGCQNKKDLAYVQMFATTSKDEMPKVVFLAKTVILDHFGPF